MRKTTYQDSMALNTGKKFYGDNMITLCFYYEND